MEEKKSCKCACDNHMELCDCQNLLSNCEKLYDQMNDKLAGADHRWTELNEMLQKLSSKVGKKITEIEIYYERIQAEISTKREWLRDFEKHMNHEFLKEVKKEITGRAAEVGFLQQQLIDATQLAQNELRRFANELHIRLKNLEKPETTPKPQQPPTKEAPDEKKAPEFKYTYSRNAWISCAIVTFVILVICYVVGQLVPLSHLLASFV